MTKNIINGVDLQDIFGPLGIPVPENPERWVQARAEAISEAAMMGAVNEILRLRALDLTHNSAGWYRLHYMARNQD